jgi:hypothetical protein
MTAAATGPTLGQIHALLAERGYEVAETSPDSLTIREVDSGLTVHAGLQGEVLFFSLPCITVARSAITPDMMHKMLDAGNGISTSFFQLYGDGPGNVTITLNNFCKLQDLGADDSDDILSCVHFLLVDVMSARGLLKDLAK